MKGNQCEGTDQQFSQALGGGGGGGAGYPAGQGKHGGNNGPKLAVEVVVAAMAADHKMVVKGGNLGQKWSRCY